ncbi:FepA family TonB-dependent siderophore receptor [Paracoccus sp. SCSIO 75233]|uniref:FepA family TonB-dependent siderophore receptor n=1 Tax=Paracoccus sp. SCSIO 75233 TaxID=3017782 RepID=UPI0022F01082|nr:FepA family TonB-dependent siderophore receptor [Paracoccus sp. SCSIO 75233]WBU54443.1 FepA family TonB-dependent siderophore receptor [Paracoccus sp. SCSIO 75233]
MFTAKQKLRTTTALGLLLSGMSVSALAQEVAAPGDAIVLDTIVLTAEEQALQALGVSNITEADLEKRPVTNDISEAVRRQPGVNLTGATATGQRGNQRQIDIRGMGPENTLILIDGKPVLSRNSVKMSRGGERDTRGDSNWVPAELVERIEVIRGPAAARYGSGASGGVVNIITKRPDTFMGQLGAHLEFPESDKEGATKRTNFMIAGPAGERLTFRLFGNYNKTDADEPDINPTRPNIDPDSGAVLEDDPALAGNEGVVNKDIGALLTWNAAPGHEIDFEANFSRQGNIYAGDSRNGSVQEDVGDQNLIGTETNRMYRRTLAMTHRGEYGFGESNSYLQWEQTDNTRLCAGTAGGVEDNITQCIDTDGDGENDATAFSTITLDNISAKTEWILPMTLAGRDSRVTLGADYRGEFLDDAISIRGGLNEDLAAQLGIPSEGADRDPKTEQNTIGIYAEANIEWTDQLTLTPALRYDHNDNFGGNLSPSLNATYDFNDEWSMKVGIARAFKAPNLYQLNPNYVYVTRGMGCPYVAGERLSGPCYVLGNPDLEPETSFNKEIGVAYTGLNDVNASLTYFHNDYDNRIGSGFVQENTGAVENRLFRWENQPDAVISGLEGNFATPIGSQFAFNANFTKMIKSENGDGQPLSLVPDYTINAALDWYATPDLTFTLSATHYGEIEAASVNSTTKSEFEETTTRDPYTLVNLGAVWDINENSRVAGGVSNVFDKTILRTDSGGGANTYNEPGRAFYLSLKQSF